LRGAGSVERLYHHPVVFGKSGKHRANKLAAPVVFRDGHSVPMQNMSPPIKTKQQMVIETFWFLHIPHHHSFATGIAMSVQALVNSFRHRLSGGQVVTVPWPAPASPIMIFPRRVEHALNVAVHDANPRKHRWPSQPSIKPSRLAIQG
jgi:hypothetical protein